MAEKKYPTTPHLPFSPAALSEGDVKLPEASQFVGCEVIITEKLDGGNCCLKDGKVYARSHAEETSHKWFGPVKAWYKGACYQVPEGVELYGENMTAVHSIEYSQLQGHFYLFGAKKAGQWLAWREVQQLAQALEIPHVPEVFAGKFTSLEEIQHWMQAQAAQPSAVGGECEMGFLMLSLSGRWPSMCAAIMCKQILLSKGRGKQRK
eukprot:m.137011 g.137011  ORF g.137011 m.137011 type:complete len:207 (-) comp20215_c0_seq2:369-989(-)